MTKLPQIQLVQPAFKSERIGRTMSLGHMNKAHRKAAQNIIDQIRNKKHVRVQLGDTYSLLQDISNGDDKYFRDTILKVGMFISAMPGIVRLLDV